MADYNDENERLTDDEIKAEFAILFPQGWAGSDVLTELAPLGWGKSPLVAIYHPSAAQLYEESVRMHRNLAGLRRKPDDAAPCAGAHIGGNDGSARGDAGRA